MWKLILNNLLFSKVPEELHEKPSHEHYPACAARKAEIEKECTKMLVYTITSSVIMTALTFGGMDFPMISALPRLFGSYSAEMMITQTIELMFVIFIGAMCCSSKKIFTIILMGYYFALTLMGTFAGSTAGCIVAFFLGCAGIAVTYRAPKIWRDYDHLRSTEGWPFFLDWYTHIKETPEYTFEGARKRGRYYGGEVPKKSVDTAARYAKDELHEEAEAILAEAEAEAKERAYAPKMAAMPDMPDMEAVKGEPEPTEMYTDSGFDPM